MSAPVPVPTSFRSIVRRRLAKLKSRIFIDLAGPGDRVFLAGMGRSGTTWVANLINFDSSYRVLFEPFDPRWVRSLRVFDGEKYVAPGSTDPAQVRVAQRILGGGVRHRRIDLDNPRFILRKRLFKEIRCNLMLKWLAELAPEMSVVLTIRHPLAVAHSWLKLGWEPVRPGDNFASGYDVGGLFDDFPLIRQAISEIDAKDPFERVLFRWCTSYYVPLTQFAGGGVTTVFYENFVLRPQAETERLFARLSLPFDWHRISPLVGKPSLTNFLDRQIERDRDRLLMEWRHAFDDRRLDRAGAILSMFGLERIYSGDPPFGRLAPGVDPRTSP